ncbi:MAG TPA: carboxylate--amine ligase [Blastocatellia bacterium]|nr:carboxylate--amine ligase [Blastocatellia bacterium]
MIVDPSELLRAVKEKVNATDLPAALVFNCHITGLAVARALGKRGVPVIGLDRDPDGLGLWSRFTTVAGRCPYPLDDESGFIELLMSIGSVLQHRAVLFPCLDEWVFAVARHRADLEEHFIFPFSELETLERILDKGLLYKKCKQLDIPIPGTYYIGEQTPEQIASEISFPCIVKPALQREFTNEFGDKVLRAETRDDFLSLCRRAAHHKLLAQEIVGAGVDSFYSLCSYIGPDGEARGIFVGRKLEQYPPDFGTACLVDSRYVDSVADRGIKILKQFGYNGISEVEYLYDERDGDFKLLDINTRVWKWIGLPIRAGVDLPWLAYAEAVGRRVEPALKQKDGIRWVYEKDYIALRRERAGPADATLSREDWLELVAGRSDSSQTVAPAILSQDDPLPFVRMVESLFARKQYYCAC